jgi:hypothetical protein
MEYDNFIIKKSTICNGFGLFALKDFSKGDKLYTKCYYQIPKPALDIIFVNNPHFKNLKMMERLWGHNNSFYTSLNVDQYINHSPNPNCCHGISLKSITAGEEIFEDYSSFDNEPWFHALNTSMGIWSFK